MAELPMTDYVAATPSKHFVGHKDGGITKVKCLQVAGGKFDW